MSLLELIDALEKKLLALQEHKNEQWYLDALDKINKLSVIW